jgi:hypothetical protein
MMILSVLYSNVLTNAPLNLSTLLFAPEAKVVKALGPKHIEKRLPFAIFRPAGLTEVRVNDFGPKMSALQISYIGSIGWQPSLKAIGISSAGVQATPVELPTQLPVLRRNGFTLTGIRGLPANPSKKTAWKLSYEEVAVRNIARTAKLRDQIRSATGPDRLKLIQQCYDWQSQLSLTNP